MSIMFQEVLFAAPSHCHRGGGNGGGATDTTAAPTASTASSKLSWSLLQLSGYGVDVTSPTLATQPLHACCDNITATLASPQAPSIAHLQSLTSTAATSTAAPPTSTVATLVARGETSSWPRLRVVDSVPGDDDDSIMGPFMDSADHVRAGEALGQEAPQLQQVTPLERFVRLGDLFASAQL